MLDKATAATEVMRRLRKMETGDSLELLTPEQCNTVLGIIQVLSLKFWLITHKESAV